MVADTPWVVQESGLATPRALLDFDVVVIRPYLLVRDYPAGLSNIEARQYKEARREVCGKLEDTGRLLEQGGLLVVILDVLQEMKFNTAAHRYSVGGRIYTVTNYDFLSEHFFHCVRSGTGSSVEILDNAEPFSAVIKTGSVQWTAFIGEQPPDPFGSAIFFARNGAKSFIGGQIALGAGSVVFLPNFRQLNEEQSFEACLQYRSRREGTPLPPCPEEVSLPAARKSDSKIDHQPPDPGRRLRAFLCHSSGDKPAVRDLYRRLKVDGFAPWLDEEELLPGQDWQQEIPAAVRACDVVIICLSQKSVSKEGFLQREIREALYVEEEKPEGTIFVIPVKLEEVEVPKRLSKWQWANLSQEGGYQRLVRALEVRASAIGTTVASHEARGWEEAERKAREAEEARLKAEAERQATKEAQARETLEAKGPASAEPAEAEAEVSNAAPQPPVSEQPGPKTVPLLTRSPQLELIQKVKGNRVLAVTLVGVAVVVIIAAVAWVYRTKMQNPRAGTVRENPKDGLKYVWIPPGTFRMGCSPGDSECNADEKPLHSVRLSRGFWIGQTEVTVGAYKRFATEFSGDGANDRMPMGNVSWNDAYDYCRWAGGRLPTEAEWEYAARGGTGEARYGNIDEIAWYWGNSEKQGHEVAKKAANGFGLYDTLGNVWEWVNDWYDGNYYQRSPSQDPSGPASGSVRVMRGGSSSEVPSNLRASTRSSAAPDNVSDRIGFRCAREAVSP